MEQKITFARACNKAFVTLLIATAFLIYMPDAQAYDITLPESRAPLTLEGSYVARWQGVKLGTLGWISQENADSYKIYAKLRTAGIARLVKKHKRVARVQGTLGGNEGYSPATFTMENKVTKTTRRFTYSDDATLTPPKNHKITEREVYAPLFGYDMLSFVMLFRDKAWNTIKAGGKNFTLTAYDGRRRYPVRATILGKKRIDVEGVRRNVIAVKVQYERFEAYSGEKLPRRKGDVDATLYISADKNFQLVKGEANAFFGKVTVGWEPKK